MRRESRSLVRFVERFGNPVDHINLDLGRMERLLNILDSVPVVNCQVHVIYPEGIKIFLEYIPCHRGVLVSGRQKAKEVAAEMWAYYSSRKIPVNVNDMLA